MTRKTPPSRLVLLTVLASSGCSTYYDETTSSVLLFNRQTLTFDDRLPGAMENVFDDCHDPMVFEPSAVIDPLGTCAGQPLNDYGGLEEQMLAIALALQDDIDLTGSFPGGIEAALTDIYKFEDVLPWPTQNCEIFIELDMDLEGLALTDLDARWMNHGGVPSLHVDFDRETSRSFISGEIDGDVDCPSAFNEPFIQPHLPNGDYTIDLSGVDLDVWFEFEVSGGEVSTSVEADFDIGGASIDPALSSLLVDNVGDIESILEQSTGMALGDLADDVSVEVETQLAPLATALDDAINDEIDAGYTVQSVSVVAGELVVLATKPKLSSGPSLPWP